jgi:hypothetical protein
MWAHTRLKFQGPLYLSFSWGRKGTGSSWQRNEELCKRRTTSSLQNSGHGSELASEVTTRVRICVLQTWRRIVEVAVMVLQGFHRSWKISRRRHLPRECWEMERKEQVYSLDVATVIAAGRCYEFTPLRGGVLVKGGMLCRSYGT